MKKFLSVFIFSLFFFFVFPPFALADSVTISPNIDTYLDTSGFANSTYNNEKFLLSNYNVNTKNMAYILIKFPLNTIPAGATISSAKLYLYLYEASGTSPITITVSSVSKDWSSNVTLVNQPIPSYDVTTVNVNSIKEYKIWDITSLVKSWQSGNTPNYGIFVWKKTPQNFGFVRKFYSVNRGNAATNPKLVVSYTPKPIRVIIPTSKPLVIALNPTFSIIAKPNITLSQGQNNNGAAQQNVTISDIKSSDVTQSDALITWKTNINANSWVFFGMATNGDKFDQKVGQNDAVTSHALNLPSLTPRTKYSYKVMSKGADGVEVFGPINYFTTTSFENESSASSSESNSNSTSNTEEQTEDIAVDPQISPSIAISSSPSVTPSTSPSQVKSQNLNPTSLFLSFQSINITKMIGILFILLGLMCTAVVVLLYKLTKKAHDRAKKDVDIDNEKKLEEGKEDD